MRRLRDPAVFVRLADACAVLLGIVVLRELLGGEGSGVAALVLLPVLFVAVAGSRAEVALVAALAVLVVAAPILVAGAPEYPPSEWRRAAVIALVAGVAGWVVQRTTAAHRDSEADLTVVGDVIRSIRGDEDARLAVCRATGRVTGASVAMLAEPDGSGHLVVTAALGADAAAGEQVALDEGAEDRAGTAIAFTTGRRLFVADVGETPAVAGGLAGRDDVVSAVWEPVTAGARVVGVLVVGWERRIARATDRAVRIVSLLATEAASVVEREGLLGEMRETERTDALTGLLNERAWSTELGVELARSRRTGAPLCLAFLDVGGDAGERGLKEVVAGWTAALRPGDRLARLHAGQFAILLPGCARDDARRVIERVRSVRPAGVTASVGLAEWDGHEAPDGLAGRTETALETARRDGPGRLVLA